jgi:DNA gyrase/topoisomerase IV subunit B
VSFVNGIATIKGGTHVDYVTNQIANHVMAAVNKKNKNANLKAHNVKSHLWVFVNALVDNPAFDSQTKETLTTRQSSFGSKCELSEDFLKKGWWLYFSVEKIWLIVVFQSGGWALAICICCIVVQKDEFTHFLLQ